MVSLWIWIHPIAYLGPDELDVCEAVFRYQISDMTQTSTYYLSVDDIDPPRELLKRLRSDNLRMERGSFFASLGWKTDTVHSMIYGLDRSNNTTFIVHADYVEGNGLSAGEDYTVIHRNGRWIVEKVVVRWVT